MSQRSSSLLSQRTKDNSTMTTELWIALSVVFSIALSAIGWAIQLTVNRKRNETTDRVQALDTRLRETQHELAALKHLVQSLARITVVHNEWLREG
jgi:hypothetical protein